MTVATCVLKKVWGRGFRRIYCNVEVDEMGTVLFTNCGRVVEWVNCYTVDYDNLVYAFATRNVMFRKGWFISEYAEVATTETETTETETTETATTETATTETATTETETETAVAELDSVVRTQHTAQVDRFYIHNHKDGITRLYWFNKSALACGVKVIVNRNGTDTGTVVREERFRSFITWEQHRENYTKYCKSVALKGV